LETAAQGLAVDGDEFLPEAAAQQGGVIDEAVAEGLGIECGEDPAEGIVAGGAVGQLEPLSQPLLALLGEAFEVLEVVHPADHGSQRDEQHLAEVVPLGAAVAWVC